MFCGERGAVAGVEVPVDMCGGFGVGYAGGFSGTEVRGFRCLQQSGESDGAGKPGIHAG